MPEQGVMHEIRGLLAQGKGSAEIIEMGYAPGTVYRLQREFRRRAGGSGSNATRPGSGQDATGDRPLTLEAFGHWYGRHLLPELRHLAVHALEAEEAAVVSLAQSDNERLRQFALEKLGRLKEQREEHLREWKASICPAQAAGPAPARVAGDEQEETAAS